MALVFDSRNVVGSNSCLQSTSGLPGAIYLNPQLPVQDVYLDCVTLDGSVEKLMVECLLFHTFEHLVPQSKLNGLIEDTFFFS